MKVSEMLNLGPVIEQQLADVGIDSSEKLCEIGAKQAFELLYKYDDTSCMHKLLALEGAVEGVKKSQLDQQTKNELKEFFRQIKAGEIK